MKGAPELGFRDRSDVRERVMVWAQGDEVVDVVGTALRARLDVVDVQRIAEVAEAALVTVATTRELLADRRSLTRTTDRAALTDSTADRSAVLPRTAAHCVGQRMHGHPANVACDLDPPIARVGRSDPRAAMRIAACRRAVPPRGQLGGFGISFPAAPLTNDVTASFVAEARSVVTADEPARMAVRYGRSASASAFALHEAP